MMVDVPETVIPDPFSRSAYEIALYEHDLLIAGDLRRIDAAIEAAENADADRERLPLLRTTRVLLRSGLFDAEYYLRKYPDVREAGVDPLNHYVRYGDGEGRMPNPIFLPRYYRERHMAGAPATQNALEHYIENGESADGRPNKAFDPRAYLAANPMLSEFVDRPLFHYLKFGGATKNNRYWPQPEIILPTLEYVEAIARGDGNNYLGYLGAEAKRALIRAIGVERGFDLFKQLVDRADFAESRPKRLARLRDYAQNHAAAFFETAAAGERFVVMPPTVIGEGDHRPLAAVTRSMFVACFIDARVRAGSDVVEVGDAALLDYQGEEFARIDQQLDYDPSVFQTNEDSARIITSDGSGEVEIEEAFTLLGFYADAFGHWLPDFLPKYIAALLSGALPPVPILIDSTMPRSHVEALELMLPVEATIIELPQLQSARVRRLWCAPTQRYSPIADLQNERFRWEYFVYAPARAAPLFREMALRADRATAQPSGADRVFLARSQALHHKLLNHVAIEAAAVARGFVIVYPEQLTFVEQVRIVRHARFLLGPDGSQMFLGYFARPGTRLCTLSNVEGVAELQAEHGTLYSQLGIDYTVITGPSSPLNVDFPIHSDFIVDERVYCEFLDWWLEQDLMPAMTANGRGAIVLRAPAGDDTK